MPQPGQGTLSAQLTTLIEEVLRLQWSRGTLPRLAYVTDDGYQPASYFRRVLAQRCGTPGRGRWGGSGCSGLLHRHLLRPATGGRPVRRAKKGPEVGAIGCGPGV